MLSERDREDINSIPPAAKCFSEKSTNCEVPFLKIHQLLSIHTAVGGFLDQGFSLGRVELKSTLAPQAAAPPELKVT